MTNTAQAIDKLVQAGVIASKSPALVAEFLHGPSLNKFKIGEYVGSPYVPAITQHCINVDARNEFNIKVLHELVKRFDYSKLDFDIALRYESFTVVVTDIMKASIILF